MKEHLSPAAGLASRARVVIGLGCLLGAFAAGPASAAVGHSGRASAPGGVSEYAVKRSCPATAHGARCLAARLVPVSGRGGLPSARIAGGSAEAGGGAAESRSECESTHKKPVVEGCDGLTPEELWSATGEPEATAPIASQP